jgi:hypothetical protein
MSISWRHPRGRSHERAQNPPSPIHRKRARKSFTGGAETAAEPRAGVQASSHRLPAVDDQGMPGDDDGRVRTQPEHGSGDLLGLPHPADRLLSGDRISPFLRLPPRRQ